MSEFEELMLQMAGEDSAGKDCSHFMEYVISRGIHCLPDVIQTGAKNGQSLKAHIQNVLCFSYHIAENILKLDDQDIIDLVAAAYIHDLNKFPEYEGMSYGKIANEENVRRHLFQMLEAYDEPPKCSIDTVVQIIRAHSGHYHVDGQGFFAGGADNGVHRSIAILRAADTLDLSHHFFEIDKKEAALRLINGLIPDFQYAYTWHYFSDNRGVYTNLIHNTIIDRFKAEGAIPVLLYPNGVWYLIPKGHSVSVSPRDVTRALEKNIARMSVGDPASLLKEAKGVAWNYNQNPFKLGMPPDEIITLLADRICSASDRSYQAKYEKLVAESGNKCFANYQKDLSGLDKLQKNRKKTEQDYLSLLEKHNLPREYDKTNENFTQLKPAIQQRIVKKETELDDLKKTVAVLEGWETEPLWEAAPEGLFNPDTQVMWMGKLVGSFAYLLNKYGGFDSAKAWDLVGQIAGLDIDRYPELRFFDRESDKGYRIGVLLHQAGIDFDTVRNRYLSFLEELCREKPDLAISTPNPQTVSYIETYLKTETIGVDESAFRHYMSSNHKQCCYCGYGKGSKLNAGDVPGKTIQDSLKVQLFSNRLRGGGGEPVRNVCEICRNCLRVEKLVKDRYDNRYYLHLFSDGGDYSSHAEPQLFIDMLRQGLKKLLALDLQSFFIQPNSVIKAYIGEHKKTVLGKTDKTKGLIVPKFSEIIAGQVSIGINPPTRGGNDGTEFAYALFCFLYLTRHFNLRGILSKLSIPPLKAENFKTLYIDHIPLSFRALIPENDVDADQAVRLWEKLVDVYNIRRTYDPLEDKEICNIAKTLFDGSGLELIYFLSNRYTNNSRTKDHKPWHKIWKYLTNFIQEERLMPIRKMAEIALEHHFHGKSWNETSQAKPFDLAFKSLAKHQQPENLDDLKMIILHDVTRGLERLTSGGMLRKDKYDAIREFVDTFFNQLFEGRYEFDKNRMMRDQKRIRAAFLGYLNMLRKNKTTDEEDDTDE